MVAIRPKAIVSQLVFLGLRFLNTNDIGVLLIQPVEKAFAGGGANAVGVQGDYAEQFAASFWEFRCRSTAEMLLFVCHTGCIGLTVQAKWDIIQKLCNPI